MTERREKRKKWVQRGQYAIKLEEDVRQNDLVAVWQAAAVRFSPAHIASIARCKVE